MQFFTIRTMQAAAIGLSTSSSLVKGTCAGSCDTATFIFSVMLFNMLDPPLTLTYTELVFIAAVWIVVLLPAPVISNIAIPLRYDEQKDITT